MFVQFGVVSFEGGFGVGEGNGKVGVKGASSIVVLVKGGCKVGFAVAAVVTTGGAAAVVG